MGPDYTQELLEAAGVSRFPWRNEEVLLKHYIGNDPEAFLVEIGFFFSRTAFAQNRAERFGVLSGQTFYSLHRNTFAVYAYAGEDNIEKQCSRLQTSLMCLVDEQILSI